MQVPHQKLVLMAVLKHVLPAALMAAHVAQVMSDLALGVSQQLMLAWASQALVPVTQTGIES